MGKRIGLIIVILVMLGLLVGCGKKGPLKLDPEMTPQVIKNFKLFQVGSDIKLQWDFEERLDGKSKERKLWEFDVNSITKIHIYHSDKPIADGKFRKKAKLLRKLMPSELTEAPPDMLKTLLNPKKKKRQKGSLTLAKEDKNYSYYVAIPFSLAQLDNKQHFFAVQYNYNKKKSPISEVLDIQTKVPVNKIPDLKLSRENKLISLKWTRPATDVAGNPIGSIAGYNIFKKVVPEPEKKEEAAEAEQKTEPQAEEEKSVFQKLNKETVLTEYFEDSDTGINGNYSYYVTTLMSNQIEGVPSEAVSVEISDIYPPDVPANLVVFRSEDHLYLNWKEVNDSDFSHYKIYRRKPSQQEFSLIADKITNVTYKDKTVRKGRSYFYAVTSVDLKGNESEYSNIAKERF